MNINLNKLRDATINRTITILNKAKSKPPTPGQQLDALIKDLQDPNTDDETRLQLSDDLDHLTHELSKC